MYELENVIEDVKGYEIENGERLKVGDMSEVEKEVVGKEMVEKGLVG